MKIKREYIYQVLTIIAGLAIISYTTWSGYKVYETTARHTALKNDYSEINDIYYGLLSVDVWEKEVMKIAQNQIINFELTDNQLDVFRSQVDEILHTVIAKAEQMVQQDDDDWRGKLRKFAVNTFVDMDKLRSQIPDFTDAILATLTRPENMAKFRAMALDKLDEMAAQTKGESFQDKMNAVYHQYGVSSKDEFNRQIYRKATELRKEAYAYGRVMAFLVLVFLIPWFFIRKNRRLQSTFLVLSALMALVVLLTGVTTPMLEIDARIAELRFTLLGEDITFEEQMIFYQSKSIIDVVWLLLNSKPVDSIVVGILILSFSVILPVSKILSLVFYVLMKKVRNARVINWLVFWSGKWSMADVMVVAIFMSYVAFDGIIQNQLHHIDRETEAVKALTTNNTALQAGFFLFVTYVFYSMILSAILKGMLKKVKIRSN